MGLLSNSTVYLAGPVENDNDPNGWRNSAKLLLKSIGVRIWDPLDKPNWIDKSFTGKAQREDKFVLQTMKFPLNSDPVVARNMEIRNIALRLASAADFIICKIGGPTVGTFEELALAKQCLKPVLFFGDLDSSWRYVQFASMGYRVFHRNLNDLIAYINGVDDSTELVSSSDWIFMHDMWPNSQGTPK